MKKGKSALCSFLLTLLIIATGLFCASGGSGALNELLDYRQQTPFANDPALNKKNPTPTHASGTATATGIDDTPQASFAPSPTISYIDPGAELVGEYRDNTMAFTIYKVNREKLTLYKVELFVASADVLKTAFANNRITNRAYTSKIAARNNAILAVNGDFCGYNADGVIIRNGVLYRNKPSSRESLIIDKDGNFNFAHEKDIDGEALQQQGVLQTFSFGPVLVNNYQVNKESIKAHFLSSRAKEPRTAIGQLGPLHYLLLVVDGRSEESEGMTLEQVANEFVLHGAQSAYGLDGGGSSTLYYNGAVINNPCVNGEREVSDIVYLAKP